MENSFFLTKNNLYLFLTFRFTYTSARLLGLNSSIVGDFFFPTPPPPPTLKSVTLESGKQAIKIESTPFDDIDSDAELDEDEILSLSKGTKQEVVALNEPESEQMPGENVSQLQEEQDGEDQEKVLEEENRGEEVKEGDGEGFPGGSDARKMNFEPDEDDLPPFEEIKDEDLATPDDPKGTGSILRDSNSQRLHYLFKILKSDSPKNSTTVGYFNKIILNLLHFYPLEIFNFCFNDQILLEDFLGSLRFNKVTEVFSKLINFEKRLYFKKRQNDFVLGFTKIRVQLFKLLIAKLESDELKPQEDKAVLKVLGDFLSRNNEIIGGDSMLDEVVYNKENLSIIKKCVNKVRKKFN